MPRSSASKKAWRLANAIDPRSRGGESSGQSIKIASKLSGWSSSTRPGPGRIWRRCGDGRRGCRLHAKVPHGRWKTMTFVAVLRHGRIDAPWLEGAIDGVSFRTYVEKVLLPVLRPGDIVILDNLGSHRGKAFRQLIRSVGAKLFFLPKYSPDRTGLRQAQAPRAQGCRAHRRRGLRRYRPCTRCLHIRGMHQLPEKLRLSNLMPSCFYWRSDDAGAEGRAATFHLLNLV
ncbi:hypothetical protein ACVIM8_001682 [Bradyrhizobium sp. USDA 4529]